MKASSSFRLFSGLFLLLMAGCGSSGNSELAKRYEAAVAISGTWDRDAALEKLAVDAGQAGDVNIVKKSLEKISASWTKDKTATAAALALAKAGKVDAAKEVAQSISATAQKEEALSRIAKGEYEK
jgi:hypothetical protein